MYFNDDAWKSRTILLEKSFQRKYTGNRRNVDRHSDECYKLFISGR